MSVIVDDQNPNIEYTGDWSDYAGLGNDYYDGTLHECASPRDCSLQFQFQGTAVYVYGSIQANTSNIYVNFTVDNGVPQTHYLANTESQDANEFQLFSFGGLNKTSTHLLEVDVLEASSSDPFWVDFIAYDPLSNVNSASSTSLPQPTYSQPIIEVSQGSHNNIGAIVGGVVGGVAGLLIIAGFIFWYLWRHRGRDGQAYFYRSTNTADMLDHEIKPFDAPGAPPVAVLPIRPTTPSAMTATTVPASYPAPPGSDLGGSAYTASSALYSQPRAQSFVAAGAAASDAGASSSAGTGSVRTYSSPNQANSKAAEAGLLSVANRPATYHADSGIRFDAGPSGASGSNAQIHGEEGMTDVPPEYSEN